MALNTAPGGESPSAAYLAGAQHGAALAVQHHSAPVITHSTHTAQGIVDQGPKRTYKGAAPVRKPAAAAPNTLNSILEAARQMASGDVTAQVNAIKAQQQSLQDTAFQHAQQIQLASQAAAKFLSGIGDQTASSYSDAAKTLAGLAGGFTGDLRNTAQGAAQGVADNLAAIGAPTGPGQGVIGTTQAQVAAQPTNLANILYNQGGYAPANLLETSGQAFAAAQRQLPAQTLAYGNQQAQGTLGQGQTQAAGLSGDIANALATKPKLEQQYLQSLNQQITSNALANSLIGSRKASAATAKANTTLAGAKLKWQQQQGTIANQIKQFNAETSRYKALHPASANTAAAAGSKPSAPLTKTINDGYLHSADGNKVILNGKPIRVKAAPKAPTVTSTKQSAEAFGAARHYHQPWQDKNGKTQPPLRWSAWLTAGLSKGISIATLMKQGRRVYTPDEIRNDSQPGYTP